jgi:imidazolonepropionase-like amidohydrolase
MDAYADVQPGQLRWLLVDALIDGTGAQPMRDRAVAVRNGRIEAVIGHDDVPSNPADVVAHVGGTLLPGLIDAHVHLVLDHGPDHAVTRDTVERATAPQLTLRALHNAQQCLRAGVTTVRDCGDRDFVTLTVRDAIAQGLVSGPRIVTSGPPVTTTAGHTCWFGGVADSKEEIRRQVRTLCQTGVDWVKVMASGGNMTAGSNPCEPQYSLDELRALVEDAHRLRRPVSAHSLNAESNRRSVAAGVDTIEHCQWTRSDGTDGYDAELVEAMAARGSWVCLTLAGIDREMLPAEADADEVAQVNVAKLRQRHVNIRLMIEAGVPVLLASDAGVRYSRFEDFWQSLRCAEVGLGLEPSDCIRRATQLAAQALRLPDVGVIAPGMCADLLIVDGDPALDLSALAKVSSVWRDGRVVVRNDMARLPDMAA